MKLCYSNSNNSIYINWSFKSSWLIYIISNFDTPYRSWRVVYSSHGGKLILFLSTSNGIIRSWYSPVCTSTLEPPCNRESISFSPSLLRSWRVANSFLNENDAFPTSSIQSTTMIDDIISRFPCLMRWGITCIREINNERIFLSVSDLHRECDVNRRGRRERLRSSRNGETVQIIIIKCLIIRSNLCKWVCVYKSKVLLVLLVWIKVIFKIFRIRSYLQSSIIYYILLF